MADEDSAPILLTAEVLASFEERLREHAPSLLERLAPGLEEPEMERLVARFDLELTSELRRWWGWRNGIPRTEIEYKTERSLGHNQVLIPLAEAGEMRVRWCARELELSGSVDWEAGWLPIGEASDFIVGDCSVARDAPTPILLLDGMSENPRAPRARSLGELVSWWIEAIDSGAWTYRDRVAGWAVDWDRLRPELVRSWLV